MSLSSRCRQGMLRRLGDMGLERLLGELAVVAVHQVPGVGICHSERCRVLLEGLGEGDQRHFTLACHIGDQRAMVALIELRPVGVAQRIEGGERWSVLAVRLLHQARARIDVRSAIGP